MIGGIYGARIDQQAGPTPSADLALSLTGTPEPVAVGADLQIRATVRNRGPSMATRISLGATLPSSFTLIRVLPSQGACSGTLTLTCALGSLAPGAKATVVVTVRPRARGSVTTSASVTGYESDPNRSNNARSVATTVLRR